jgi:hypothetical protein
MKTPLATLAAFALAATVAASPAAAAAPSIGAASGVEGTVISVPVSHRCKVKKCFYVVKTVDGTAVVGADYAAVEQSGRARKKRTFAVTLAIPTIDDAVCEHDETFTVHVDIANKNSVAGFDAAQTITDNDCPPPAPPRDPDAPPIDVPANPSGAIIKTEPLPGGGMAQSCVTPFATGVERPELSPGFHLDPCHVVVRCPTTTPVCTATAMNRVLAQGPPGFETTAPGFEFTSGGIETNVVTASGGQTQLRNVCFDYGTCAVSMSRVSLTAGEWLIVSCSGMHDPRRLNPAFELDRHPEPGDPTRLTCDLRMEYHA